MNRFEYGEAYEAGFERTVRFLISKGARGDGAQEAAQAAWARGWERLDQLRSDSSVYTWINSIALNYYRGFFTREAPAPVPPDLPGGEHIDLAAIDVDCILRRCRPADRTLIEQHMEGVTAEEIARENGVTETAIRIRLMRARRAVRSQIEKRAHRLRGLSAAASAN